MLLTEICLLMLSTNHQDRDLC